MRCRSDYWGPKKVTVGWTKMVDYYKKLWSQFGNLDKGIISGILVLKVGNQLKIIHIFLTRGMGLYIYRPNLRIFPSILNSLNLEKIVLFKEITLGSSG